MILQLSPLIPMDTPKGPADAFFVIDYGRDAPLMFVCFVRETGECWCCEQRDVRLEKNVTSGVRGTTESDYARKAREVREIFLKDSVSPSYAELLNLRAQEMNRHNVPPR